MKGYVNNLQKIGKSAMHLNLFSLEQQQNYDDNMKMYNNLLRIYEPLEDYFEQRPLSSRMDDDIDISILANQFNKQGINTHGEVIEYLESRSASQMANFNIPLFTMDSILQYQMSSAVINPYVFRQGDTVYDDLDTQLYNSNLIKTIRGLDSAIEMSGSINNEEMTLYRGMSADLYKTMFDSFANGEEYINKSYISTSSSFASALDFNERMLEIVVPPNSIPALDMK